MCSSELYNTQLLAVNVIWPPVAHVVVHTYALCHSVV